MPELACLVRVMASQRWSGTLERPEDIRTHPATIGRWRLTLFRSRPPVALYIFAHRPIVCHAPFPLPPRRPSCQYRPFPHMSPALNSSYRSSSSDIKNAGTASTDTFVTALVFNLIVFGAEIAAFTLIRPRFPAIYQPRTHFPVKG